jgi:hypothetical protein
MENLEPAFDSIDDILFRFFNVLAKHLLGFRVEPLLERFKYLHVLLQSNLHPFLTHTLNVSEHLNPLEDRLQNFKHVLILAHANERFMKFGILKEFPLGFETFN